jgi:hypothetical protein
MDHRRARPAPAPILGAIYLALAAAAGARADDAAASAVRGVFPERVVPFLKEHCTPCHGEGKSRGDLVLEGYADEASLLKDRAVWEKVLRKLKTGAMPPRDRPRPNPSEVRFLTDWIDGRLREFDCGEGIDPGRVTARRLNRAEYRNTVRDLLGVDFQPADDFPSDDVGYGFDNIGDVLSMSPLHLEKYLDAAEEIAATPGVLERLITCRPRRDPRRCAREVLEPLALRAYRRPPTDDEVRGLVKFVDLALENGDDFRQGIQLALEAVLVSPHFLFRLEFDPPGSPPGAIRPLDDFELASRLSYFLWSSAPDEALLVRARAGELRSGDGLASEARRLLADPKASALTDNFAAQWLQTRNLRTAAPDRKLFPGFDDGLRAAMVKETELFFATVVQEDRSVLEFLDSDFILVNGRLARHYGISGVEGDDFRRIPVAGTPRGGVLTQASVLTVTSNPTRTSPVKRGKWILEQVLGAPPPPPPPEVPDLEEGEEVSAAAPLRKRMEEHRTNPACAVCHQDMDALGFAFENFDATGAWRDADGKFPIDASGELPGGQSFEGARQLKAVLLARKEEFARCLSEKLLTFALGRGLEYHDRCAVDEIGAALARDGWKFSTLVVEIVKSVPFRYRRTAAAAP